MENFKIWLSENLSWFGFVLMCLTGSIVAHIKAYEAANSIWTIRQHYWGLIRRMIYGAMAGMMVYALHLEYNWSGPLSFVATGISSIFASDFFDFLWITAKAYVRKRLGLDAETGSK